MKSLRGLVLLLLLLWLQSCQHRLYVDTPEGKEYENLFDRHEDWRVKVQGWMAEPAYELERLKLEEGSANGWIPLFSFLHISDVQIRDAHIRFAYGFWGTRIPDEIAGGVKRIEVDKYDEFPFIGLVGAINGLPKAERPLFMIHTGDSLDVGTFGEFMRFCGIANALEIPWFNVIGNHDHYYMGTFRQHDLRIEGITETDLIPEAHRFALLHSEPQQRVLGIGRNTNIDMFDMFYNNHEPTQRFPLLPSSVRTHGHGFDLGPFQKQSRYYSFSFEVSSIKVRGIVLDTTLPADRPIGFPELGAEGGIDHDQFVWLENQLVDAFSAREIVFMFGHHPIHEETTDGIKSASLKIFRTGKAPQLFSEYILSPARDMVYAYFCGHTHRPRLISHPRVTPDGKKYSGARPLLEVVCPSLHECPQFGYWVSLYQKRESKDIALSVQACRGIIRDKPAELRAKWESAVKGCIAEAESEGFDDQLKHLSKDCLRNGSINRNEDTIGFFPLIPTTRPSEFSLSLERQQQ